MKRALPDAIPESEVVPIPDQPGFFMLRTDYGAWLDAPAADRHTRAIDEFEALGRAASQQKPPCSNDPRFVADEPSLSDRREMQSLCTTRCEIRAECWAYAMKARPSAGIWAGFAYHPIHAARPDPNRNHP